MKSSVWSKIIGFLTIDWKIKIAALLLAVGLWFFVHELSSIEEKKFLLTIEYQNAPPGWILVDTPESVVEIVARGRQDRLSRINIGRAARPVVRLDQPSTGMSNYKVELYFLEPQAEVAFSLSRDRVPVVMDRVGSNRLPVLPDLEGNVPEGYVAEVELVTPVSVEMIGPQGMLNALSNLKTLPIPIDGMTNSFVTNVGFEPQRLMMPLSAREAEVKVKIFRPGLDTEDQGSEHPGTL